MKLPLTALLVFGGLVACKDRPGPAAAPPAWATTPVQAAGDGEDGEGDGEGDGESGIRWIRDDYPAALARAREEKKPLFIDMWAAWCHTCLSMKHYVFIDPGLAPLADRFVWLAVDTDRAESGPLLERFPVEVWPTFYVVSPEDESIQGRHLGAASVAQLRELLLQGEKGHLATRAQAGEIPEGSLLWHVRAGDRAAAAGELEAAARAYRLAFEAAPEDYARLPELMVSLAATLVKRGAFEACADFALEHGAQASRHLTTTTIAFADFTSRCAHPLGDRQKRSRLLRQLDRSLERLLEANDAALSLDDRSYAYEVRRRLAHYLDEEARALTLAEEQRALLDRAFQEAPTPHAAMTFGWHLAEVYVFLDRGKEVVPKLEVLMRRLPGEYDPPHRLAWVLLHLGDLDRALEVAERSLALAHGPRKGIVQELVAEIHRARRDSDAEIAAREALVELYEALPAGQKRPDALGEARAALAEARARNARGP